MRHLFCGIFMCIISLNAQSIEDCLTCHADEELQGLTEKAQQISMYIDSKLYDNSVHASLNCVDCHQDLE
jgi:nitrate reductase cytochrome c-type subunit